MEVARVKAAKTLLSEQNFAVLDQLGGNVGDHVNKALEMYMRAFQSREGWSVSEGDMGAGGDAHSE